jgi:hypothetical protein
MDPSDLSPRPAFLHENQTDHANPRHNNDEGETCRSRARAIYATIDWTAEWRLQYDNNQSIIHGVQIASSVVTRRLDHVHR